MCSLCDSTQNFDPARHMAGGASYARVSEGADAPAGLSTPYSIGVGDSFVGTLSRAGDRDWIAVSLEAGTRYQITLDGGSLSDPYLRLYSSSGTLLYSDDDGGGGLNSLLSFTPSVSGRYYLAAGAYSDGYSGSYTLSLNAAAPVTTASLDTLADYLSEGYWNWSGAGPRAFDTSASNQITVNLEGLSAAGKQLARWALQAWERVANLEFVETRQSAQITFQDHEDGAYASSQTRSGEILSSTVNISSSWLTNYGTTLDSYSFSTYVHEIGHALGLGHQGPYNGQATFGRDEAFANDSWQVSVMSYFSQSENTNVAASYAALLTPMMADIVAMEDLYGAPGAGSPTAGNTVYGLGGTIGGYLGRFFALQASGSQDPGLYRGEPVALTLYDQSGYDRIDLSYSSSDTRLDLNGGSFSDLNGLRGNLAIARGTVIEAAILGSGNDLVLGNGAGNHLQGGAGSDSLLGGAGDDLLNGEASRSGFDQAAGQVFRLYGAALDRLPDFPGHLDWSHKLNTAQRSLEQVAEGFTNSIEFQSRYGTTSNPEYVTLLYNNVLDRAPDAAGLADWTAALNTNRLSRAEVLIGFSESAEYQRQTGPYALEYSWAGHRASWSDEVFRLYQATLDRKPDFGGLENWTAELANGVGLPTVTLGFVNSPEFQARYGATSNQSFVSLLYENVLGRDPDAAGLARWSGALDNGTLSRSAVVLGFSESAEFRQNSADSLLGYMRELGRGDRLEAGQGADTLFGGWLADSFVFEADDGGRQQVVGLEAWDRIELHEAGFADAAAAQAALRQSGEDVLLSLGAGEIRFLHSDIALFSAEMFDLV